MTTAECIDTQPWDDVEQTRQAQLAEERAHIAAAQAGDAEAFGLLYTQHVDAIQKRILHMSSGDADLAADLTQDTFLKAFRGLHGLVDTEEGMRPWLFRIAGNTVYDYFKRDKYSTVPFDPYDPPFPEIPVPSAERQAVAALTIDEVLSDMPDDFAQSVILQAYGFSGRDAAEILDITEGTHRSRTLRGREAVKDVAAS